MFNFVLNYFLNVKNKKIISPNASKNNIYKKTLVNKLQKIIFFKTLSSMFSLEGTNKNSNMIS